MIQAKPVSLAKELEDRVLPHVQSYLEIRSSTPGALAADIEDIRAHCLQKDPGLRRFRRIAVERAILNAKTKLPKPAFESLLSDSSEGPANDYPVNNGSHNGLNKSITSAWKIEPQSTMEKRVESPKSVPTSEGGSSKRNGPNVPLPVSKRKAKDLKTTELPKLRLADVGGVDDCIHQVRDCIILPLQHPEIYTHIGVQTPRGVLLYGPPGCGKTMLANAIAGELQLPFISLSAPSLVSGLSGESEKQIRDVFEDAKSSAPCLMFLDEIDAITPKRESVQREMERRIVAQLLTCMDDLSLDKTDGKPVIIIGATNRPDSLDPALRRAGRFDREICLPVPDEPGRMRILEALSKHLRLAHDFDYRLLAKRTPGFVGADLSSLIAAAGVAAIKRIFNDLPPPSGMDIDSSPTASSSALERFLTSHPQPLTPEQLEPLAIDLCDFWEALPTIQPSSKREGFATVPDVTWQDVGALHDIQQELKMAITRPIESPELFERVGITAPVGVLLWGPPGCGKTLLAKAVANESRANFISVRGPELLNKYVGESERAVRQVFLRARASAPCIIFFDELDALVPRRDDSLSEASARVVNTLLTELDGLSDRRGVYVIAATNRPDIIDSAMLRPGRLDKQLFIRLPGITERAEILRTLTKKMPISPDVDLMHIAADSRCNNFR